MRQLTTLSVLTTLLCFATVNPSSPLLTHTNAGARRPEPSYSQPGDFDRDCQPTSPPPECQRITASIRSLESRIERLESRLTDASPPMKADLNRNIADLNRQRDEAQAGLRQCLRDYRSGLRQLADSELDSVFTGTAKMETTHPQAAGPFTQDIRMGIRFTRSRCNFSITSLNRIRSWIDYLPSYGRLSVEVTRTDSSVGRFHPVSGAMTVPVTLRFHYLNESGDNNLILRNGDNSVTFRLGTSGSVTQGGILVAGRPLAADGSVTLVDTSRFMDVNRLRGFLYEYEGRLVIQGRLDPRP